MEAGASAAIVFQSRSLGTRERKERELELENKQNYFFHSNP
jgi:hypothetical protein